MAGHSKWKNIRLRKGKQDAIRGKLFTKLAREIIVAAKMGGGDPGTNARLRVAIQTAKENSVPKENIDRAVAKGSGGGEGTNYEELLYEGTGPSGVAVLVEVYSDNRNRTVGELRHTFSKNGGAMGENGSQSWQFKHCGQIVINKSDADEDTVTLLALDNGAEDVVVDDDTVTVLTPVPSLHACNDALSKEGIHTHGVELTRIATTMAELSKDEIEKVLKLVDALEDLDDVRQTYVNIEIPDDMFGDE